MQVHSIAYVRFEHLSDTHKELLLAWLNSDEVLAKEGNGCYLIRWEQLPAFVISSIPEGSAVLI